MKHPNANKPLTPPRNILGEAECRGRRIVCTDDPNYLAHHIDGFGFKVPCIYTVLDEFDEVVFPIGMHVFWTPADAANAIYMLDMILPTIKAQQPHTSLMWEYGLFRCYRRDFFNVYHAVKKIENVLVSSSAFGENPSDEIAKIIHHMHQHARQSREIDNADR